MATGITTPTTADKHIREVWAREIMGARQHKLIVGEFVDKHWTKELGGWGDKIHIGRMPNIESATKTPGTAWDPYVYTDTDQEITVNLYEVTGFKLEAITKKLANPAWEAEMTQNMGYSLGLAVETTIVNKFQSFSQTVGTAGVEVSWDNLLSAWTYHQNAAVTETSAFFFSVETVAGLMKQDEFINSQYRGEKGPRAIEQAYMADILNSKVYQVPYLRTAASGQHDNALMCSCTIALVMAQAPKMFTQFVAADIADVVGAYQIYGCQEMNRYSPAKGNITATDEDAVLVYGK